MILDSTERNFERKEYSRIVSLVPSITQTLIDLGITERIVGVTAFCPNPEKSRIKVIGGTKNPRISRILELKPDLILANIEENPRDVVEELSSSIPTFVTYPKTVEDNFVMVQQLVKLLKLEERMEAKDILSELEQISKSKREAYTIDVFCPIWADPYMSINYDTYINSVLRYFGMRNVTRTMEDRYPVVNLNEIYPVDLVIFPSEPYEFTVKEEKVLRKFDAFKSARFIYVDGSYLSWYGSHAIRGIKELSRIFRQYI